MTVVQAEVVAADDAEGNQNHVTHVDFADTFSTDRGSYTTDNNFLIIIFLLQKICSVRWVLNEVFGTVVFFFFNI